MSGSNGRRPPAYVGRSDRMAPAGLHADDDRTGGASRTGDPGGEGLLPHRRVGGGGLLGLVAALALTVLGTGTAEAFFPTNFRTLGGIQGHSHEAITTDALEALDAELFGAAQPT